MVAPGRGLRGSRTQHVQREADSTVGSLSCRGRNQSPWRLRQLGSVGRTQERKGIHGSNPRGPLEPTAEPKPITQSAEPREGGREQAPECAQG